MQDDAGCDFGVRVLKCCTQSAIASHAIRAKRSEFAKELPWNSVAGSWTCDCSGANESVVVRHEKKEQCRAETYDFTWCVELIVFKDPAKPILERAFVSSITSSDQRVTQRLSSLFD
jgi:hypothetical protein